jgi:two-component system phosphate regulon response regulator PhoB
MNDQAQANPILVVDDHPDTADALTRMLRKHGYHAVAAYGGDEAIRLLRSLRPAAVVLDVMMPGTDGQHVLRHIRDDERLRDVPVVMFSADYTYETMCESMRMGAQDFVVKGTVGWNELCTRVGQHAARQAS